MRQLSPAAIYVTKRAIADPLSRARMERMLTKIKAPAVEEIDDRELAELVRAEGWDGSRRLSGSDREGDPPIVFNRFRWEDMDDDGRPTVELPGPGPALFYGFGPWTRRQRERVMKASGIVCQTAWELHSIRGCIFSCQYCYFEYVLNIMLDMEEFAERVMGLVKRSPQTLYKYDNQSDVLAFEPEYGASALLTEQFGRQDRAFLMHYTKSDNVDPLIGLKHNGMSIVCWTLSSHTVSREIERDSAPMERRIEAARRCQRDGYHVRFRFSPIFPLPDWREEYRQCIELLFSKVKPDVISLLTLSRLPDYEMIARLFDKRMLEPRYLEAAEKSREEMKGRIYGPLPQWVRQEIYEFMIDEIKRVSPETPVAICLETPEMWESLEGKLEMGPEDYVCCCGPTSTPGDPRLATSCPHGFPE